MLPRPLQLLIYTFIVWQLASITSKREFALTESNSAQGTSKQLIPLDFNQEVSSIKNPFVEMTSWGTRKPPMRRLLPQKEINWEGLAAAAHALKYHDNDVEQNPELYKAYSQPRRTKGENAAILYLSQDLPSRDDYDHNPSAALCLLFRNFNNHHQYPVYIFHGGFYNEERQKQLMDWIKETNDERPTKMELYNVDKLVEFVELKFEYFPPDWPPKDKVPDYPGYPNYAHMIAFWFKHVFEHPKVKDLDYYLRQDTDSYILSLVTSDPFKQMRYYNFVYGYTMLASDLPDWVKGLWDFVEEYAKTHPPKYIESLNIPKRHQRKEIGVPTFYNNFEAVDIKAWTSPEVMDWVKAVLDSKGIYLYRWGDAPLRWLTAQLFFRGIDKDCWQMCDILYQHGKGVSQQCTFEPGIMI